MENKDFKEDYLKIGDIVLFCRRPGYGVWRKGKIVSHNFAMCNLPDFFGKPTFYVSELDENDNVVDDQKSTAMEKDSPYLIKFKPGMEWCIGKGWAEIPRSRDFEQEEKDRIISLKRNLKPFDPIIVKGFGSFWHTDWFESYLNIEKTAIRTVQGYNILQDEDWYAFENLEEDGQKYKELLNLNDDLVKKCGTVFDEAPKEEQQIKENPLEQFKENPLEPFKETTWDDYMKVPGIKELAEKEEQWKKDIEEKLDNILTTLNFIYWGWAPSRTTTYPYTPQPLEPYYNPYNPYEPSRTAPYDPERWKVYCDNGDSSIKSNITLDEIEKYRTTFSVPPSKYNSCDCSKNDNHIESISVDEYNNYNSTTSADVNSEFCQTCLDSSIDTYGLYKANNNLKNNKKDNK